MTVTLAISPSYCNITGKLELKFNSIAVQIFDLDKNQFYLNGNTYPTMQYRESIESMRKFILERINNMLKIFQSQIEDSLNDRFANATYFYTDKTKDYSTPCNLTKEKDIENCPLAVPIRSVFEGYSTSSV